MHTLVETTNLLQAFENGIGYSTIHYLSPIEVDLNRSHYMLIGMIVLCLASLQVLYMYELVRYLFPVFENVID